MTGPSGSGKTTLLTIIGALRASQEGSVKVFGRELTGADTRTLTQTRLDVGYIFQQHNLLKSLTAAQNVAMSLELRAGMDEAQRRRVSVGMLTDVGLGERVDYVPARLSGGQKQRVSIARALVARPRLVLALGLYDMTEDVIYIHMPMPVSKIFSVFAMVLVMCMLSGALAMRKMRSANPADMF